MDLIRFGQYEEVINTTLLIKERIPEARMNDSIIVLKRDGSKEPLTLEKWQAQITKVCSGIADVSQSMIEIKASPHFYDGITTREIDAVTLRAIVD